MVLFHEASVVSSKNYKKLTDYGIAETAEPDFDPEEEEEPFEDGCKLYCLSGSLRFHKVKAVETKADEYTQIGELFISDLDRSRFAWL